MLSTLRYRIFTIRACFEKQNDKLVLKIALNKKRELGLRDFRIIQKFSIFYLEFLMRNLGLNRTDTPKCIEMIL